MLHRSILEVIEAHSSLRDHNFNYNTAGYIEGVKKIPKYKSKDEKITITSVPFKQGFRTAQMLVTLHREAAQNSQGYRRSLSNELHRS